MGAYQASFMGESDRLADYVLPHGSVAQRLRAARRPCRTDLCCCRHCSTAHSVACCFCSILARSMRKTGTGTSLRVSSMHYQMSDIGAINESFHQRPVL